MSKPSILVPILVVAAAIAAVIAVGVAIPTTLELNRAEDAKERAKQLPPNASVIYSNPDVTVNPVIKVCDHGRAVYIVNAYSSHALAVAENAPECK